jgi:hypothetical protein
VELIFLNISSKVLTLSLGLEPDIFTLQANSPTTVLLTVNDKLVNVSIHSKFVCWWKMTNNALHILIMSVLCLLYWWQTSTSWKINICNAKRIKDWISCLICYCVELIFLNISSKVLTLSLGLEPDIFTLQANSPTSNLSLLHIHRTRNLSVEDVINKFAVRKNRRLDFI